MSRPAFDTLALHAGQAVDPVNRARATPIYQTTSYLFEDAAHAAGLFDLSREGHIYSRISNPTVAVLEERLAALEGGVAAIATASGQAAMHLAIATALGAGKKIVAARNLYGGSINLLRLTLPRFGVETTFVDPRDLGALEAAIDDDTRLVFAETVGNPGLEVFDIAGAAEIAHRAGVPLMIDNTFATPWCVRPIEHGADIVMHSLTKWIGGHGVAIGGGIVDAGRFDWTNGKFPTLSEPYAGYDDLVYVEKFGPAAFAARARTEGLRDFGACLSPTNAFHLIQGLETLPLRMARHVENAAAVAAFLESREGVAKVHHPSLSSHPDHQRAKELAPRGLASVVTFELEGGKPAGAAFIEGCELASHLANVGDAKTLVIHPASTTHSQLGPEALRAAGVGEGMVRVSVGLEAIEDILADLAKGLAAANGA